MKDRVPSKVLDNGAIRYGVYDESGTLEKYQYLKLEDEPIEEGSALNKANLLPDSVCERFALSSDAEIKDAFNAVLLPRLTVDIGVLEELTLTASKDDYTMTASNNGQYVVFDFPSYGKWTISDGTTSDVIDVQSVTNIEYYWTSPYALNSASWSIISELSKQGTAANYFAVGDCKKVEVNGTVGTLELSNEELYVFILGFNHNSAYEGTGIHFNGFKTKLTDGVQVCLVDSGYSTGYVDGTKHFNMNHWGPTSLAYPNNTNYGGWGGCDLRYDILGSTDTAPSGYGSIPTTSRTGYNASSTCATKPVANTLMAALPSDLRAVMKPMTKYTDNVGNKSNVASGVSATVDYLVPLAEFEVFGKATRANTYEQNYQKQYDYYAAGNSSIFYRHSNVEKASTCFTRSPYYDSDQYFCLISSSGKTAISYSGYSYGLCPVFKV
jgi:hypothetical protein